MNDANFGKALAALLLGMLIGALIGLISLIWIIKKEGWTEFLRQLNPFDSGREK